MESTLHDRFVAVVTTIQEPTSCMRRLAEALQEEGIPLVIVGDEPGPDRYDLDGAELFSLEEQKNLEFSLARHLPTRHYARKNLGYLVALSRGASCIYETDDDNAPRDTWRLRSRTAQAQKIVGRPWVNVFRLFSDDHIWPRGFPLDLVRDKATFENVRETDVFETEAPIQQGLANGAPDVDAIWRLLLDRDVTFRDEASVVLPAGTWCPFNSQSTWWRAPAFPLMYLPSYCSFRMTDIWRSFIAQRCLWEMGHGVVFHGAEVIQERNPHNLMRDFNDEIPGYSGNARLTEILSQIELQKGADAVAENLRRCYEVLVENEFFLPKELTLVEAWCADVKELSSVLAE